LEGSVCCAAAQLFVAILLPFIGQYSVQKPQVIPTFCRDKMTVASRFEFTTSIEKKLTHERLNHRLQIRMWVKKVQSCDHRL
jgi:hypothetical protein